MWTWSIALTGTKTTVLRDAAALTIPVEEELNAVTGTRNQIDRTPEEIAKYDEAKADIAAKVSTLADGMQVAVSCSGNGSEYKLVVRPFGKRQPNVHDLLVAISEADEDVGLDKFPGARDQLQSVLDSADAKIAATAAAKLDGGK